MPGVDLRAASAGLVGTHSASKTAAAVTIAAFLWPKPP
jgi:hypothetical protein